MISLRKSADELERVSDLHEAAVECYEAALRSVAEYSIEVDPAEVAQLRSRLDLVRQNWRHADSSARMNSLQGDLQSGLKEYKNLGEKRIDKLRKDLEASARAVQAFTENIASQDQDHRNQIHGELAQMERLADTATLDQLRAAVHRAAAEIGASLEQMRQGHQMVIAQLRDEIRLLHEEAKHPLRPPQPALESGAFDRDKADETIAGLLRGRRAFCLLFLTVRNLERLRVRHSPAATEIAMVALLRHIQTVIGPDVAVGRWSPGTFAAILDTSAGPVTVAHDLSRKLSGSYPLRAGRTSEHASLDVTVGVLDHSADEDTLAFSRKLAQLSAALESR